MICIMKIWLSVLVLSMVLVGCGKSEEVVVQNEIIPEVETEALVVGKRMMEPEVIEEEVIDPIDWEIESFVGILSEVNTGCFADGECYIKTEDGKHVTAIMGWSRETVGSVKGADGFGDLEAFTGKSVTVYARKLDDNTYTLYGDENFYIDVE